MDKKKFLEMYKDDIIAQPSGISYEELLHDNIDKLVSEIDENKIITKKFKDE